MYQKNVVQPAQKFTNTTLTLSGGNSKPIVSIKNSKANSEKRFAAKAFENKNVCALEKLSYDLLQLCGVKVPKTYIIDDESSSILLSRIEPGYKNFLDLVGGECNHENNTFTLNKNALKRSVQTQSISNNNKDKHIVGLFENVAVFMFLGDWDTIGNSLQNLGLIEHEHHFQAIKIDPGLTHITPSSLDNSDYGFQQYLTGLYSLYNSKDTDFFYWGDRGNNSLVFSSCTPKQAQDGIHQVSNLTDTQLYEVIHNEKIPFLNFKDKEGIYQLLKNRRDTFSVFLKEIKKPNFNLKNFLQIHVKPSPIINSQLAIKNIKQITKPSEPIVQNEILPRISEIAVSNYDMEAIQNQELTNKDDDLRLSSTTDDNYQQLQLLKSAVNRAVTNYKNWFDGNETKNRGRSNGFFTWARHGKKGQKNATSFFELINQKVSLDSAITLITNYLTAPSTRYHTHSFASYLLDELKHFEAWLNKNMAFDETTKRYEQQSVLPIMS